MRAARFDLLAGPLLLLFAASLVLLNWGRWGGWDSVGFRLYLTQPIMVTTLFDFAWVLGILTLFIHHDARRHGLTYWWILPTYPFMPTVGLLAYLLVRTRRLRAAGHSVPPAPGSGDAA